MNKDLTVGNPSTVLWKFCLPMFGSVVFQQLYNIADSLVAGKFVGEAALAAVGNSYEITLIFIAFAFGCNIGCSVIVSRFFGAKQYRDMKTAVTTSLIGCAALVALLMLVGLAGCDALLELINTPEEILADSALYLDIYVLGLPFMFFYNVATGIFSCQGVSCVLAVWAVPPVLPAGRGPRPGPRNRGGAPSVRPRRGGSLTAPPLGEPSCQGSLQVKFVKVHNKQVSCIKKLWLVCDLRLALQLIIL